MSETISFVLDELVSEFYCSSAAMFREDASGRVQISAAGDPARSREESVVTTAGGVRVIVEFGFTRHVTERQRLDARAVAQTIAHGYAAHLGLPVAPQNVADRCVLVVDNDVAKRERVRDVLTTEGFTLLEASDGLIGHARALEFAPDLIILNAIMPRLDGYEVAARLRSDPITASIPILMLMRRGQSDGPIVALGYGIVDILFDPFESHELLSGVATCLGRQPAILHPPARAPKPIDYEHVVRLAESAAQHGDYDRAARAYSEAADIAQKQANPDISNKYRRLAGKMFLLLAENSSQSQTIRVGYTSAARAFFEAGNINLARDAHSRATNAAGIVSPAENERSA